MSQAELIDRAISIAGSQPRLAELSGLSQQFISKLKNGERGVTAETAVKLETAVGIARSEWRPDLWPAPVQSPEAA